MIHRCLSVALLLFTAVSASSAEPAGCPADEFRVVGYLPDYRAAGYDTASVRHLTDLIVFSAEPTKEGDLDLGRLKGLPWADLRTAKTKHRVRLILCVGGWGRSTHFPAVAASETLRRRFVGAAVRACLENRVDGLDLDWEHPKGEPEETGYARLLDDLRVGFRPHGLTLSVTMAAWQHLPREAFGVVDAVHVMSYDHPGRHATLEAAKADVKALRDLGAPSEKIVLGLPFYGRHVSKPDVALTYRQIVARYHPAPDADEVESVYYNGPGTVRRKTAFAQASGLGGVMVWELAQDAAGTDSLLRVVRETVRNTRAR